MTKKCTFAYYTTMTALLWLICAFIAWQLTRTGGPLFFILAIQILPLLAFLPKLFKRQARAFIWLCFVILVYFIKGVLGAFKPQPDWMDLTLLILSVVIFISAMLTSRWLRTS